MSHGVIIQLKGFPTLEVQQVTAKIDSDSAKSLLQEKLRNGILKWKAHKERESVAEIQPIDGSGRVGLHFDSSKSSQHVIKALTSAEVTTLESHSGRDGSLTLVFTNGR